MLYFDNASTTYIYSDVINAINNTMMYYWGNPSNLYTFGLEAREMVNKARTKIAESIGAYSDEIIFTSCASESNALAINQRDRCFCSPYEHHDIKANLKTQVVNENYVPTEDPTEDFHDCLYAHMLVNNETGEVFDLAQKINDYHKAGALVLVDATQALGNISINVHELGADFVSFSFHKVHAPKGIGALYIRNGLKKQIKPLIYGTQEYDIRGGTSNVPYIVGAGMAVEKAVGEMDNKNFHSQNLRKIILDKLKQSNIDFIVNEGKENIPSILNISFKGVTGEAMMLALDMRGISVSTGSACNTGDQRPSEVLMEMGVPKEYLQGAIRISTSLKNSAEDAKNLAEAIVNCYYDMIG